VGSIVVEITGPHHAEGCIVVGLYSPTGFQRFGGEPPVASAKAAVSMPTTTVVLQGIPDGTYAVAVYHDENDNGRLDLTSVGVPAEGRGYSNTPTVGLAVPDFAEAKFDHQGPETWVRVQLAYLGRKSR
jgi:uncharacterized protein (DUF2141 family)